MLSSFEGTRRALPPDSVTRYCRARHCRDPPQLQSLRPSLLAACLLPLQLVAGSWVETGTVAGWCEKILQGETLSRRSTTCTVAVAEVVGLLGVNAVAVFGRLRQPDTVDFLLLCHTIKVIVIIH